MLDNLIRALERKPTRSCFHSGAVDGTVGTEVGTVERYVQLNKHKHYEVADFITTTQGGLFSPLSEHLKYNKIQHGATPVCGHKADAGQSEHYRQ